MKKKYCKKSISVLLAVIVMLGMFAAYPISANATSKTADQAISWCQSKLGTGVEYSIDEYRYQCVDFIQAYYSYLGVSPSSGSGYQYATNTLPSGWTRTYGGKPQKGDILVYTGGFGHVAIYESDNVSYHQNWSGPYVQKLERYYSNSFWVQDEGVTKTYWGCIHPNFNGVHTHNYNTYVYYWAAHPHYNCYKCSCGDVKENRNETRPISTCAQCLAEYKPNASISKDVYHVEESVTVKWDKINKATHYNVRLYKVGADGNGSLYATTYNITDTSHTFNSLTTGQYYLYAQTYNKYYWMADGSDYFHSQGDKISFSVIDEHTPTATAQYGESSYEYYNYQMSWLSALKFCERRGGHLAVVNSAEENEVLYQLAKPYTTYAWLGGTDDVKEGNWYWINSEDFTLSDKWNSGEPNNDGNGEHCLELMTSDNHPGQWNDISNESTRVKGFICEYDNNRTIDLTKFQPVATREYNGKTYEVFDNNLDWQTAKLVCERKGGHLVVIDDANENSFVGNLISSCGKDEYWLGISDYMDEGDWVSVLGEKAQFTKWTSGEPSNSWNVEDYAVIKKSMDWNDLKGYSGLYRNIGFICEYEPKHDILGDSDGDGEVSAIDVARIMRACAKIDTGIDEDVLMNGDVDGNGKLEIIDATWIQRHLAKMDTPYAIGETKG